MRGQYFGTAAIVGASLLIGSSGVAQDASLGQEIFQDRCAVCHGDLGKGDGLVAELFDRKPEDLTLLAQEQAGEFPFERVFQSIDGRTEITGHGKSKMPIWGEFFMESALADRGVNPKDARAVTEGRILAVVYYLQSIQAP